MDEMNRSYPDRRLMKTTEKRIFARRHHYLVLSVANSFSLKSSWLIIEAGATLYWVALMLPLDIAFII